MATLTEKLIFDTDNSVTITLASLGDGSFAESATIDNSTDKFVAADVQFKVRTGTGVSALGKIRLYMLRSVDGGTDFDDAFDTFTDDSNAALLVEIIASADSTDYIASIDTSAVGLLGSHWRLVIANYTGASLDSTASNHYVKYTGKKFEIA